jgi:hypothetical protein
MEEGEFCKLGNGIWRLKYKVTMTLFIILGDEAWEMAFVPVDRGDLLIFKTRHFNLI